VNARKDEFISSEPLRKPGRQEKEEQEFFLLFSCLPGFLRGFS
jgi:hypothetical protein